VYRRVQSAGRDVDNSTLSTSVVIVICQRYDVAATKRRSVFSDWLSPATACHLQERVTELLGRVVVDDRVDTRVEVRQTVPQHAHSLHRIVNINVLLVA